MIELYFLACLAAEPTKCREHHLSYAENVTPMQCMTGSQAELAKWATSNPKWTVKRWGCRPARMYSKA